MTSVPRPRNSAAAEPFSAQEIVRIYRHLMGTCARAGLSSTDAEDVAQDVWAWLLQGGDLSLALTAPWMSAVARNFILRYWRRRSQKDFREGMSLEVAREPHAAAEEIRFEARELLDRMEARLPRIEAALLVLIRRGYTFVEAADALQIPRGSRAYFKNRLVECGRRQMRRSASASGQDAG